VITLHCRPPGATPTGIRIGGGLASALAPATAGRRVFALVDDHVAARHPGVLAAGWHVHRVQAGEDLKTMPAAAAVLGAMARASVRREDLLLALGGGTVGDLGGFCAALWLRGIELWQVPTTLLAMVDSAVGGKTAVNLPEGKNLVGVVHPASTVVVDLDFVATLPEREYRSGLAEAIKVGLGLDAELFALLEQQVAAVHRRDPAVLAEVVHRSLAAKIAIVESDLRETGARRLLNLGHSLGHALEAHSGWQQAHGLCVARGLYGALDVAQALGAIDGAAVARGRALLRAYGHEPTPLPPTAELLPFLARDKKVAGGLLHYVVPTGIGRSEVRGIAPAQVAELLGAPRA
jgi:3-dehydroquinate synthase